MKVMLCFERPSQLEGTGLNDFTIVDMDYIPYVGTTIILPSTDGVEIFKVLEIHTRINNNKQERVFLYLDCID